MVVPVVAVVAVVVLQMATVVTIGGVGGGTLCNTTIRSHMRDHCSGGHTQNTQKKEQK